MRLRGTRATQRKAIAVVEMAICLPVVAMLLVGIWEVGRFVNVSQVLGNAARVGARQAATGQHRNTAVESLVRSYLREAMIGQGMSSQSASAVATNATVIVQNLASPGADASFANQMDQVRVTVSVPFRDVRWISINLVTSGNSQLTAEATWNCMKDHSFPTTITAPLGF